MGNCISFQDEYQCSECNQTPSSNQNLASKANWITFNGKRYCKHCYIKLRTEQERYKKERAYYSKAKEQLYPKQTMKQRLKRINSDETWDHHHESFYDGWRPPSSLAHLVQALGIGHRKGTGFVGDSAADIQGEGSSGTVGSTGLQSVSEDEISDLAAQMDASHRSKMDALDEELTFVEEEDISHHGGSEYGNDDGDKQPRRRKSMDSKQAATSIAK